MFIYVLWTLLSIVGIVLAMVSIVYSVKQRKDIKEISTCMGQNIQQAEFVNCANVTNTRVDIDN